MATLIVRPDKIGDLVLSTSVVEAIKEKYPEEKIFFIVSKYAKDILKNNPKIEDYIAIDDKTKIKEIVNFIKINRIDKTIILFPNFKISLAIKLAKVDRVIFPGFRIYQFMFKDIVYLRRSKAIKKEWEYNIDLAKKLFPDIEYKKPKIYLTEEELERARWILKKFKRPIVGLYPGGGKEHRWPQDKFKELASKLESIGLTTIVLLGPNETDLLDNFSRWYIGEMLSLRELIAVISELDLFITNNTGPMHIRGAFEKPMIQIFDPRKAVNPIRWGYDYPGAYTIKPAVDYCSSKCNKCKYKNCMNLIEVDIVFELVKKWQKGSQSI